MAEMQTQESNSNLQNMNKLENFKDFDDCPKQYEGFESYNNYKDAENNFESVKWNSNIPNQINQRSTSNTSDQQANNFLRYDPCKLFEIDLKKIYTN